MSGFIEFTETDYGSKARAKAVLEEFPKELTAECRWRIRVWWEKVLDMARQLCAAWAYDTGTLYNTIRIEDQTISLGGSFEKAVSPEAELIDSMIVAGGLLINPKTGRICDYAQAVHDGHFTRGGRWIPPKPFLQVAIDMFTEELITIINTALDKTINTIWIGE